MASGDPYVEAALDPETASDAAPVFALLAINESLRRIADALECGEVGRSDDRVTEAAAALRRIEHWPFDVMRTAEEDRRDMIEFARQQRERLEGDQ
jgi:hypothetical protein